MKKKDVYFQQQSVRMCEPDVYSDNIYMFSGVSQV